MKNYEDANNIEWGNLEDMKKALAYYEKESKKFLGHAQSRWYWELQVKLKTAIDKIENPEDVVEFTWD